MNKTSPLTYLSQQKEESMLFNWNKNSLKSGVYQIRNLINGKVYIGSAKEFKSRGKSHLRSLERQKHHNKHLQGAFNKDGSNNFVFEVLEVVEGDKLARTVKEKEYLDQYLPDNWEDCYNFQQNPLSADRSCWSKDPELSKKKIKQTNLERYGVEFYSKLPTEREKNKIIGLQNYKHLIRYRNLNKVNHPIETCRKISENTKKLWLDLSYRQSIIEKLSIFMKKKWQDENYKKIHTGKNSPLYGRKISEEHKKIISTINKGNKYSAGRKLSDYHKEIIRQHSVKYRHSEISKIKISNQNSKTYNVVLLSPDGTEFGPIVNLTKFCETHQLNRRHIIAIINKQRKSHKKWTIKVT